MVDDHGREPDNHQGLVLESRDCSADAIGSQSAQQPNRFFTYSDSSGGQRDRASGPAVGGFRLLSSGDVPAVHSPQVTNLNQT
ncbi:hypothetical protein T265_07670 [Opisthorchis viverrini]|uniref:Uncharacterized protein n=1 Tax=Opisthorchis viverrini TaxID=6198 RepID=A0A074Z4X9_OPIVI|nr:hypothetical protein T265_07670 [Opisthorchis viverrini]XP_009177888.1 hypothetical protein T265_12294 [Opisthorchis viverrini]KER18365.1 hypothetical protein T265_12294 [Opisthorchis viverrini]KER24785.1 hypothetical protein T265_07670 [Opisthorchis viverrini]